MTADSSKTRVAFIAESAWGTTPATPTFVTMRRTSGNMRTNKTVVRSDEIQLDRNTRQVLQTGQDAAGSYDFELSYGSLDALLEAALQGAWTTDVLTVGGARKPFTFEETIDLNDSSFSYSRFVGCEVNSLSLNFAARDTVKGSVALMGKSEALATAILSGATYTAPNTNTIETGVNFASLAVHSLSPLPRVKSISLQISNGLRVRDGLGDLYSSQFGSGKCAVTGSIEAYFSSNALYQAVLDHGAGALQFTVGAVTAKKYTFAMPAVRFLDGARVIGGSTSDVMVTIPFEAEGTAAAPGISITRAVA